MRLGREDQPDHLTCTADGHIDRREAMTARPVASVRLTHTTQLPEKASTMPTYRATRQQERTLEA